MKSSEKKSFFTIFSISFFILTILGMSISFVYYEENKDHIERNLLYQMREYTFDFKNKKFTLDIVKAKKRINFFQIYSDKNYLYAYFKFPKDDRYNLKVSYSMEQLNRDLESLVNKTIVLFLFGMIFIVVFSLSFAFYAIKPMKTSMNLLEMFLKDLIHDLNTPVTSIILNVKLLARQKQSEELDRIELSAKTISSLYKNLEILKNEKIEQNESIDIEIIIKQKVKILRKLYPKIEFIQELRPLNIKSNLNAISRILENILTNACKYNKKNGKVYINIANNIITIQDTGIGIKKVEKVFDRYYKENERGLGIGMNIVKKLCDELNIKIQIQSKKNVGTTIKLIFN